MFSDPSLYATALLGRWGIVDPPDVFGIATALGVDVEEQDVSGFDGALVRLKGSAIGIISVRRSINEVARKRFTVAHELGHLLLPGHDTSTVCASDRMENWAKDVPTPEMEANQFAAELLMPAALATGTVRTLKPTFEAAETISRLFHTSLTASAYRFTELTSHAVAVVWSSGGRIRWFKRSAEFAYWIRVREKLDPGSLAYDLFNRREVAASDDGIAARTWLDGDFDHDDRLVEHSRAIPSYGGVLTLLWIPEPFVRDQQDDDSLPELDPRDFSLGRRRWPNKK